MRDGPSGNQRIRYFDSMYRDRKGPGLTSSFFVNRSACQRPEQLRRSCSVYPFGYHVRISAARHLDQDVGIDENSHAF